MKALKYIILLLIVFSVFIAILMSGSIKHIKEQKQSEIDSLNNVIDSLNTLQLEAKDWQELYMSKQKKLYYKERKKLTTNLLG